MYRGFGGAEGVVICGGKKVERRKWPLLGGLAGGESVVTTSIGNYTMY